MTQPFPIYVGYDIREHLAWLVCQSSLQLPVNWRMNGVGRPDRPLMIVPLSHKELRRDRQFRREWKIDEEGQTWDLLDGRPFSTEFSHSRFLVPHLAMQTMEHRPEGERGWAMFVDCDFLFRRPVTDLLKDLDPSKAIYVVKHDFARIEAGIKMDGMVQQPYHRKLWSSLVLWNLDHPKVREQSWIAAANQMTGADMHRFCWFDDEDIGALDERWNWIPGHSDPQPDPFAVHWSLGGPWMSEFVNAPFAREWDSYLNTAISHMADPDGRYGDYENLLPIL